MASLNDDGWPDFSGPLAAYYRNQLIAHADDLVTQICAICHVHQCPDWRAACDRLRALNELTTSAPYYPVVAELDRKPRP